MYLRKRRANVTYSEDLADCPNTQPHMEAPLDFFPDFPEGSHCFYTMKVNISVSWRQLHIAAVAEVDSDPDSGDEEEHIIYSRIHGGTA